MRIQQSTIDKILEKADIVEVVGEYVKLEKKGNDYKGLCPFHNDSNPSLSVSPGKRVYKCFSCNEAGNVVRFVEKIKNVNYVEALKILADKYGVELDIKENPHFEKQKKCYNILKEAANTYEFYLKNTKEGEKALEYLHDRKLTDNLIKRFGIGLSGKDVICKTLLESGKCLPIDLKEVKLVDSDRKDIGKYYDFFQNRIMFPIKNLNGEVVGFSGRIFPSGNPKYINSPENFVFKKGNILYNYSDCYNDIKLANRVYLFEGFMDVIAACRANINNSVASMGTSLTEYQIKAIKNLTNNVVICYDSDEPGIEATKRAIRLLTEAGMNVSCIYMTETKDADEFVAKYGEDALKNYLENKSLSSVDYLYEVEKKYLNLSDPNSIISFQKNINNIISLFKNKAIESYLVDKAANDLNVDRKDIKVEYSDKEIIGSINDLEPPVIDDSYDFLPDDLEGINNAKVKNILLNDYKKNKYLKAETALIYIAYNSKDDCLHIRNELGFKSYVDKINRGILYKLYDYYQLVDKMNSQDFFAKLDELEFAQLNSIINTQNIFLSEEIDSLINTVLQYQYEKDAMYIKEEVKKNQNASVKDLEKLINSKKRIIKINKSSK